MYGILRGTFEFVRDKICKYYYKYRLKGPRLEEVDKVYLLTRNLYTKRLSRKLDFKKIGPFKITKKISTLNYELDLLKRTRLRALVFHISLLKPAPRNAKLVT